MAEEAASLGGPSEIEMFIVWVFSFYFSHTEAWQTHYQLNERHVSFEGSQASCSLRCLMTSSCSEWTAAL